MPGPVTFNIDYTVSPDAINRTLEYRWLNPFNVFSAWTQNFATGINTPINTFNGTVLNFNINPAMGDLNQFYWNTVYEFRVKTICKDGTVEYSDPTEIYYQAHCPEVRFSRSRLYGEFGYSLDIILYDPAGHVPMNPLAYSIISYQFDIYSVVGVIRTFEGTFTASVTAGDIIPGDPYFQLSLYDSDLINGIVNGSTYELDFSFVLTTGTGTINVPCTSPSPVTLPQCSRYKIYTNEFWNLEYTDCTGIRRTVSNIEAQPQQISTGFNWFYICSMTEPKGSACYTQNLVAPFIWVSIPPELKNPPGPNIVINNPVMPNSWGNPADLLYGAVVEIDTVNACPYCENGDITVISQNNLCYPFGPVTSVPNNCT